MKAFAELKAGKFRKLNNGYTQYKGRIRIHDTATVSGIAAIGKCVTIGARVTVERLVTINAFVKLDTNAFVIHGSRHTLCVPEKGYVKIGCFQETVEYWLANYQGIGCEENYTLEQILEYGAYLKSISDNTERVFSGYSKNEERQ